jgi:hypothetical protein
MANIRPPCFLAQEAIRAGEISIGFHLRTNSIQGRAEAHRAARPVEC